MSQQFETAKERERRKKKKERNDEMIITIAWTESRSLRNSITAKAETNAIALCVSNFGPDECVMMCLCFVLCWCLVFGVFHVEFALAV